MLTNLGTTSVGVFYVQKFNAMNNRMLQHIDIKNVLPTATDVAVLIKKLDEYQISLYGIKACNLESPESLAKNGAFMLGAYVNDQLCGIGSVKLVKDYAEVKRMFVDEQYRGLAIADQLLNALMEHVKAEGISEVFLETGNLHHAAIRFYLKHGFRQVDSFGKYKPNGVSIYFGRSL
ncbi:MAG: GNAT family N-acetyltransferase [Pedobacter sp.]|nr:GNAT family N-acetyltransferase [Pedobacter sp.]